MTVYQYIIQYLLWCFLVKRLRNAKKLSNWCRKILLSKRNERRTVGRSTWEPFFDSTLEVKMKKTQTFEKKPEENH